MIEVAQSVGAAALWLALFVALVLLVRAAGWWPSRSRTLPVLAAYPAFCALQVLVAKLLAAFGVLTTPAMLVAYAVAAAAAGGALLALRRRRPGTADAGIERGGEQPDEQADADLGLIRALVLGCGAAVVLALAAFTLVTPVHIWDVLAYHMPMVASYIQNGSLDAWPTQDLRQVYRVNGGELQLLNVALLSASDAWVELPNALALAVCLVASFELARVALRHRALPYLVVALVLTAPQILLGATTAKNDLIFTAVLLSAFVWALRAVSRASDRPVAEAGLAAVSGGVAAATKVMGLNVLGAVGLLVLALALLRRVPLRVLFAFGATAALTIALLVGDIYWGNFTRSAVPVGVAPNEVIFTSGPANIVAAARYYLFELSFRRLVVLQMFEHDLSHYGYFFPLLLALGAVAAVRQVVRRQERRLPLSALALVAAALFVSVVAVRLPIPYDQRFMTWLVPTVAILAASLAERADGRHLLVLTTAAVSFALVNLFHTFSNEGDGLFTRSATHLAVTGSLPRVTDVPSRHYTFMSDGFAALDSAAGPRDSVLYVGSDDSWMYPSWGRRFTRTVRGVASAADAADQLAARRPTFVVIESAAAREIREAATAAAARAGYEPIVRTERRVILRRGAPVVVRSPRASGEGDAR